MKVFEAPAWEQSASSDKTYEQLFKSNHNKSTKGILHKIKENKLFKKKNQKKKVKKLKKQLKHGSENGKSQAFNTERISNDKNGKKSSAVWPNKDKSYKFSNKVVKNKKSGEGLKIKSSAQFKRKKAKLNRKNKPSLIEKNDSNIQQDMANDESNTIKEYGQKSGNSNKISKFVENSIPEMHKKNTKSKNKKLEKLKLKLRETLQQQSEKSVSENKKFKDLTLREKMMERLKAAKFRYLNEQMYSSDGSSALRYFKNDPNSYKLYHEGYQQQLAKWPMNPLDIIIRNITRMPEHFIVADFGCGEAKLAKSVKQKVHSFDLVALNDCVQVCDMAHVPLENSSVDVAVFCLSLMGTNLKDYLLEANRVLKIGGILKIAEVESRFDSVDGFIKKVLQFGFTLSRKDLSNNLFCFMDFKKKNNISGKNKLQEIKLKPCIYKKR